MRGTLSYSGKAFTTLKQGEMQRVYGWQGITSQIYPELGKRYFCYCDVPDLQLFPKRYSGLQNYEFRVSLEVPIVHWTMWGLSWLVRAKILRNIARYAPLLKRLSHWFDRWGSND